MNEYAPKYWKHGVNVTVEKNIPSDAVFYICGDDDVSLHFLLRGGTFSVDCDTLSALPEYEGYKAEELETEVSS